MCILLSYCCVCFCTVQVTGCAPRTTTTIAAPAWQVPMRLARELCKLERKKGGHTTNTRQQVGDQRAPVIAEVGVGALHAAPGGQILGFQKPMSRIPVPSQSPQGHRSAGAQQRALSPVPFPDRASSPLPGGLHRHQTQSSMSSISSSMAETRKKQTKRDEVSIRPLGFALACSGGSEVCHGVYTWTPRTLCGYVHNERVPRA